ncbi:AMP-binding protein [Actinomadura oligospora]|uniref:AMP-binding protein n=1 Tax=Actinomadura oligospora TaxID=111804 RepID=UPI00047CE11B|nr:AMP-binding protein [Actinomadura oligospora]
MKPQASPEPDPGPSGGTDPAPSRDAAPVPSRDDDHHAAGWWRREVFADDLAARADDTPDAPAYVNHRRGETVTVTFAELAGWVERLAAALRARRVGRGEVVAFQLPNVWEAAALWLACGRAGAVAAALPPWFERRERDLALRATSAALVVGMDGDLPDRLPDGVPAGEPVALDELVAEAAVQTERVEPVPPVQADELCQLAFTPGTTGPPKAVAHTFNTRYAALCAAMRQVPPGAATSAIADLTHTVGLMFNTLAPLMTGRPSVFRADDDLQGWLDLLAAQRVGCVVATPPVLRDLVAARTRRQDPLPSLHQVISVGAPLPAPLAARLRTTLAPHLVNGFSTAETGMLTASSPALDIAEETLGRPVEGVRVRLRPGNGARAADIGRLEVLAPGLCRSVVDLRTRERVWSADDGDGWYSTGDLVERDVEGRLRHLDRVTGRMGGDGMVPTVGGPPA